VYISSKNALSDVYLHLLIIYNQLQLNAVAICISGGKWIRSTLRLGLVFITTRKYSVLNLIALSGITPLRVKRLGLWNISSYTWHHTTTL